MNESEQTSPENSKQGMSGIKIFFIFLSAVLISVVLSVWAIKVFFFPSEFKAVKLRASEEQILDEKVSILTGGEAASTQDGPVPEKYQEKDEDREVEFTEKELNALIGRNQDLAKKLAIDLSENMVSANLLLPLDKDLPIFGGNTLKVKGGLELSYNNQNPVVILKGISVMGVPIPNAWLGGIKNIDLVSEFGDTEGFWKSFGAGVENIEVKDGSLKIKLKA